MDEQYELMVMSRFQLGLSLICHYFYRFCFLAMLENFTYFARNYASIYLFCPKLCRIYLF